MVLSWTLVLFLGTLLWDASLCHLCAVLVSHSQTRPRVVVSCHRHWTCSCSASWTGLRTASFGEGLQNRTTARALPGSTAWLAVDISSLLRAQCHSSSQSGLWDHVASPSIPTFPFSPHTALPRSWFEIQVVVSAFPCWQTAIKRWVELREGVGRWGEFPS